MTRRERQMQASGPDAFGARRVLPAMTGSAFMPGGTCPSCGSDSHPGLTCYGRTTLEMYRFLRSLPGTIYVPLVDR